MIKLSTKLLLLISSVSHLAMAQQVAFDTNFVELDLAKMVHTSDNNYAILHTNFTSNWRCISVNGDEVIVATRDNVLLNKRLVDLTPVERTSLDTIRNQLTTVIRMGPFNVKSQTGLAKLTSFDRNGGSSSMGSGGGSGSSSSSSSSSSTSSGGVSISKTGANSYIVSKSDFAFNWHRVFVNDDIATIVYKTGRVVMLPQTLVKPDEREKLAALRQEVDKNAKDAERLNQSFASSFRNPMAFVNKALGGMFGR